MTEIFFQLSRNELQSKNWLKLPIASKIIYPVIGSHCNREGLAFPGVERIAQLAGIDRKTVKKGIDGLLVLPRFQVDRGLPNRYGKRKYIFTIRPLPIGYRGAIFFHKQLIDSGTWASLTKPAKSTYLALRAFSYFDSYYCEAESPDDPSDWFRTRKNEITVADQDVIAEFAGISEKTLHRALSDLYDHGLIFDTGDNLAVYFKPSYEHFPH